MCYFKVLPRSRSGEEKKDIEHFFVENFQSLNKKSGKIITLLLKPSETLSTLNFLLHGSNHHVDGDEFARQPTREEAKSFHLLI